MLPSLASNETGDLESAEDFIFSCKAGVAGYVKVQDIQDADKKIKAVRKQHKNKNYGNIVVY